MSVLRIIGYVLLLAGIVALGFEIVQSLEAGRWILLTLGQVWAAIDRVSLNMVQVGLERYIHPFLWDPVFLTVLLWPAWLVFGVLGGLLIALGRRRRSKRMFS